MSEYTVEQLKRLDYTREENYRLLRWTVAEAAGWRVEPVQTDVGERFKLMSPTGSLQCLPKLSRDELYVWLPDYGANLNVTDALLYDTPGVDLWTCGIQPGVLAGDPIQHKVTAWRGGAGKLEYVACWADENPCVARCIAFLQYHEWKQTQETKNAH